MPMYGRLLNSHTMVLWSDLEKAVTQFQGSFNNAITQPLVRAELPTTW